LGKITTKSHKPFFIHRYSVRSTSEGEWKFPGDKHAKRIEEIGVELAKKVFGAKYADLKYLSGHNCMNAVVVLATKQGEPILHIGEPMGHLSIEPICERLGNPIYSLPFDPKTFSVDLKVAKKLSHIPFKMIYLDATRFLFPHPVRELREIFPESLMCYDGSQVMGLIAGGEFQDPLSEGADMLVGSTHKSFPGPQKAMLLTNKRELWETISERAFPVALPNHHLHHVAALTVTLAETVEFGKEYAQQIIKNSITLAQSLYNEGIKIEGKARGFTKSHQVWVDLEGIDASHAIDILKEAGIHANSVKLPSTNQIGLRLGTNEITRLGMKEKELNTIGKMMADALLERRNPQEINRDSRALAHQYCEIKYCFPENSDIGRALINVLE